MNLKRSIVKLLIFTCIRLLSQQNLHFHKNIFSSNFGLPGIIDLQAPSLPDEN